MFVPSDRHLAMVAMREGGKTLRQTAETFGVSRSTVQTIERRVRRYRDALAVLHDEPLDIAALALTGKLPQRAAHALRYRAYYDPAIRRSTGVRRLDELAEWTVRDLERMPEIGSAGLRIILNVMQEHGLRPRDGGR